MTDIACPSCDAPAPARARRCARCGYSFLEDGPSTPALRRPRAGGGRAAAAVAAVALVAVAVAAGTALLGDGGGDVAARDEAAARDDGRRRYLELIARRPLGTGAVERLLTNRYLSIPDDDETDVRCSPREARPAHSVRRCYVLYPGGIDRRIIVITNANGSEVLSER